MSRFMNSVLTAIGIAIAGLVMASTVQAAPVSTAVLGNLNSPANNLAGTSSVGRVNVAIAQGFTTGSDSMFLELTKILMDLSPDPFVTTNSPVVQLWSSFGVGVNAKPDALLANYVSAAIPPTGIAAGSPAAIYEFTGYQALSANTNYWVVVRDAFPATGKFAWDQNSAYDVPDEMNGSGFAYLGASRSTNNGLSWSRSTAIDGAVGAVSMELHAVPEPPTIILAGLGAVAFVANGYRRKKQRRDASEMIEQLDDAGAIALTA